MDDPAALPPRSPEAFANSGAARLLGMRLVTRDAEHAVVEMRPGPEHLQEQGIVQGGLLSTLADAAAVRLVYPDLPASTEAAGVGFEVQFLRPGLVDGGVLSAVARPLHLGRSLRRVVVRVHQDERELLRGTFTYLVR